MVVAELLELLAPMMFRPRAEVVRSPVMVVQDPLSTPLVCTGGSIMPILATRAPTICTPLTVSILTIRANISVVLSGTIATNVTRLTEAAAG